MDSIIGIPGLYTHLLYRLVISKLEALWGWPQLSRAYEETLGVGLVPYQVTFHVTYVVFSKLTHRTKCALSRWSDGPHQSSVHQLLCCVCWCRYRLRRNLLNTFPERAYVARANYTNNVFSRISR